MRKIKYRKGRKVQPNSLEYTGVHKNKESEMQLFVYDEVSFSEYVDFEFKSDQDLSALCARTNLVGAHHSQSHADSKLDCQKPLGKTACIGTRILQRR